VPKELKVPVSLKFFHLLILTFPRIKRRYEIPIRLIYAGTLSTGEYKNLRLSASKSIATSRKRCKIELLLLFFITVQPC